MVSVLSVGAYVPKYRLAEGTLGWEGKPARAVCNFDEDSLTMACAAGREALRGIDRNQVEALFFATTTPPFLEHQNAALLATALDLCPGVFTADVTGTPRAGTIALQLAADRLAARSARKALVLASDARQAMPKSDLERQFGDAAAAVLLSADEGVARLERATSRSEYLPDVWRADGDPFSRSWEDRFVAEEGYLRVLEESVAGFFADVGYAPTSFARVVLPGPDRRRHAELVRKLGFRPEQAQDPFSGSVGNAGTALPLLMLVAALEKASPDDLLLLVGYGSGVDLLGLRVCGDPRDHLPAHTAVRQWIENGATLPAYEHFARWRGLWPAEEGPRRPPARQPAATALWREAEQNIRLHAGRCCNCGYVQYPPQRVCVGCRTGAQHAPVRLSDRRGTVFTFSLDYLAGTPDVPLVVAVVDFEGGPRMIATLTDREVREVRVGLPVEMSFRRLASASGTHNYYWKAMPERVSTQGGAKL